MADEALRVAGDDALEGAIVERAHRRGDGRRIRRRHGKVVEAPPVVGQVGAHDDERPVAHERRDGGGQLRCLAVLERTDQDRDEGRVRR